MQQSEIMAAIEQKVGNTKYDIWTVGITDDPQRRRTEHDGKGDNTKYWKDWGADTETIAKDVEKYFLAKGMNGGPGGSEHPSHVYVF